MQKGIADKSLKNSLPLVSVVIPTYNHQQYVREALVSVIEQDYPDIEIIAVDDGSTDKTPDIAEEVLSASGKTYKLIRQKNQGVHGALNTGIGIARGEFISILNSDDFYHKSRVSRFVAAALENKSHFLFSKVLHVGRDGEALPVTSPLVSQYRLALSEAALFPVMSFELIRYNYAVTSGNFFFSRGLNRKIGGFKNYTLCHDWDFILKALIYEEPLFVDDFLMSYRIHGENVILVQNRGLLREMETEKVLFTYLEMAECPDNGLAPCWKNWGRYWHFFVRKYMPFAFYFRSLNPFLL